MTNVPAPDNIEEPTIPSEYLPRWLKTAVFVWPLVVGLGTAGVSLARSDSQLDTTVEDVRELREKVDPLVVQSARIEERQITQNETLKRVEDKLDRVLGH